MLYEKFFETRTKGLVQGPAILTSIVPTVATKMFRPKSVCKDELNLSESLINTSQFKEQDKPIFSWKIMIRSLESKEIIWVRPFVDYNDAIITWIRLVPIDLERVNVGEKLYMPSVYIEGDFEYVFATVESYTSTGTTSWTCPGRVNKVEYLVVGAGAGGGSYYGGGGGAGGYRTAANYTVSAGTGYTVTVGAKGTGRSGTGTGFSGSNSVFDTITSKGGGGGAGFNLQAGNGGSGGGATYNTYINSPGTGTAGEGNNGGAGYSGQLCGGGGGGASATGSQAGSAGQGGNGGAGSSSSISGASTAYAGGGGGSGGSGKAQGTGGSSVGGAGAYSGNAGDAVASTGSGGGGINTNNAGVDYSGDGSDGIVILSYTKVTTDFNMPMLGM